MIKSLSNCFKIFSETTDQANKINLLNYIDQLLIELKAKTDKILSLLTEKILDKVYEY